MKTVFNNTSKTLIITVRGDLDHHSEKEIREEADKIFDRKGLTNFLFDFRDTGFMDSAGIGVIMGRYKKAGLVGGMTAVTGIDKNMDRILRVSGVYRMIKQYPTVEEGVLEIENNHVQTAAQERSEA